MSTSTKWHKEILLPGAVIPESGTAREYHTGAWRGYTSLNFNKELCNNCFFCFIFCPDGCIKVEGEEIVGIDTTYCKGCGICVKECKRGAITIKKL